MANDETLTLLLEASPAADLEELVELTAQLRSELLDLDVGRVDLLTEQTAPGQAKGLGSLAGWLAVQFGADGLRVIVRAVRDWARRTNAVVEVGYGGDTLKVTGATSEQQEKIIDAWLARHASGA